MAKNKKMERKDTLHQVEMENNINWKELEERLSEADKEKYKNMQGDQAHEFLITNPQLDPTTARNLRVRYILVKAVEDGRINTENISLHDSLFKALGEIMMKETRTEEEEHQATELREQLDELWTRADPTNSSHHLAMMYAKRS